MAPPPAAPAVEPECGPPTPSEPSGQALKARRFTGQFVNARGNTIQITTWHPKADCNAAVLFLHGYGSCMTGNAIWHHVAEGLTAQGLYCMGFDYEGHGQSGGKALVVEDLAHLVDDAV